MAFCWLSEVGLVLSMCPWVANLPCDGEGDENSQSHFKDQPDGTQ